MSHVTILFDQSVVFDVHTVAPFGISSLGVSTNRFPEKYQVPGTRYQKCTMENQRVSWVGTMQWKSAIEPVDNGAKSNYLTRHWRSRKTDAACEPISNKMISERLLIDVDRWVMFTQNCRFDIHRSMLFKYFSELKLGLCILTDVCVCVWWYSQRPCICVCRPSSCHLQVRQNEVMMRLIQAHQTKPVEPTAQ